MISFISSWLGWVVSELIFSLVFWAAYQGLKGFKFGASDRFLFLKLFFISSLILPLFLRFHIARTMEFLPIAPNLNMVATASTNAHYYNLISNTIKSVAGFKISWMIYLGLALYGLAVGFKLITILRSAIKINAVVKHGTQVSHQKAYTLFIHEENLPPATVGLFEPKILISKNIFENTPSPQLKMILAHELVHIQRKDYFFNFVCVFADAMMPFSPFIFMLKKAFQHDMELSCDERVLNTKEFSRKEYGELLLGLSCRIKSGQDMEPQSLFISNSFITRRIHAMKLKSLKGKPAFVLLSATVLLGSSVVGLTASAIDSKAVSVVSASLDPSKEFSLNIGASVVTNTSNEAQKTQISLNSNEVSSMTINGVEIRISPIHNNDLAQMKVDLYDVQSGNLLRSSVLPFKSDAGLSVTLSKPIAEKVAVKINRI